MIPSLPDDFPLLLPCRTRRALRVFFLIATLLPGLLEALGADGKPLLMLGDKDYPPVAFLDDGIAKGMDVDLAKALGQEMNREVRVELMDWNLAQEKLLRGEADGLIGMSITTDRKTRFDFANPTFTREFSILVRAGDVTVRHTSDFKNKKIGVTPGGFPRSFLENQAGVNLVLVTNYLTGFNLLKEGALDAMAVDLWVAAYLMEKNSVRGVAIVDKPFTTAPTAIAVRKGNSALLNEINQALSSVRAKGKLSEIEAHWKPQEMLFFSRARIRRFIITTGIALLAMAIGAMALSIITLKRQIRIRKTVESALRESEKRLRTLTDASFEGICVCQDGILVDANEQMFTMLGYKRAEIIGKSVMELVAPSSREFVRRTIDSGIIAPYEHTALRKDGTTLAVEVCGRTISTHPHHLRVTAVRDIAERKQAEEHLKLLQTITLEVAAVGDLASALEIMLRRVCEKTGWVLGQAWMPNRDETALQCCPAFFAAAAGLEEFRTVSSQSNFQPGMGLPGQIFRSRQSLWVRDVTQESNFPRVNAAQKCGIKAALGVPILSRDEVIAVLEFFLREPRSEDERLVEVITAVAAQIGMVIERKRAEEALRKSEERFSRFFALAPAAMAVTLPSDGGRILDVNREFTKVLGYSHGEAVGRTTVELLLIEPNTRTRVLEMARQNGEVKDFDLHLRAKNGAILIGRYSAQMIEIDGETVLLSAFTDITQSKQAEEQIRASREQLRALAGRLQAVREEERTRIAREIHDILAQELTRLKIDLGWLSKRLGGDPKELDCATLLEKVETLNRLADTTIGTVQKIAAELRPVVLDSLGLSATIEWQAEEFQNRTGIHCEAIVPEDEPQLDRESATGLFRIVQESLTNIVRHANATHVDIILEADGGQLRLEVRDNGVGFDETQMKDPHSLGLLGMRERALLLYGAFEICGVPGKGTRVSVTMPLAGASVTDEKTAQPLLL